MSHKNLTREVWLLNAVEHFRGMFESAGYPLPDVIHVSMGFPSSKALSKNRTIGQCWAASMSSDGNPHIFVSPVLHDGRKALGVLVHELIHAALPEGTGHKGEFVVAMKKLGLIGKPTHTEESDALLAIIDDVIDGSMGIGPYPHAGLDAKAVEKKKQTTRMLKVSCPHGVAKGITPVPAQGQHGGYLVRLSRKMLDEIGAPICPACGSQLEEEPTEGEEEVEE